MSNDLNNKVVSQGVAVANYKFCNETIDLKGDIESKFLELGKRLYKIREGNKFLPNYDRFEDFCLELKMSGAMISKLINIYQKFILTYAMSPKLVSEAGGWSVVAEVLPVVDSKKSAEKWLSMAVTLSRGDLRKEIREKVTGIVESKCKHEDTYTIKICRSCGLREQLYEKGKNKK